MVDTTELKRAHDDVENAVLAYRTEFDRPHPNLDLLCKYANEWKIAHDKFMALAGSMAPEYFTAHPKPVDLGLH